MPIPMGVVAETGAIHPRLTEDDLRHISPDSAVVLARCGSEPRPRRRQFGGRSDGSCANGLGRALCVRRRSRHQGSADAADRLAQEPGQRREAVPRLRRTGRRPSKSNGRELGARQRRVARRAGRSPARRAVLPADRRLAAADPVRVSGAIRSAVGGRPAALRQGRRLCAAYAQKVVEYRAGVTARSNSGAPPSGCRATPAIWRRRCSPARSAPIFSGRATPLRSASGSDSR